MKSLFGAFIGLILGTTIALVCYVAFAHPVPKHKLVLSGSIVSCEIQRSECGVHVYHCDGVEAEIHCAHDLVESLR